MGIVNVTPDSFSDGGKYREIDSAVEHAMQLIDEGAEIIDVGGESTRPYASPVSCDEELRRVIPVIERLASLASVPISIDTWKSDVADAALAAGAEAVNDVSGLERDPRMVDVALKHSAGVCVMHSQGTPQNMQDNPVYGDVVTEIINYLRRRKISLVQCGINPEKICLDPGIGFGKTHAHNIALMQHVSRFHELASPILVGHSRKGFIGKLSNDETAERLPGTIAATLHLIRNRIQVIRVHDVKSMRQAWSVESALNAAESQSQRPEEG
ncbi:MAG TPA: dihydropteroate synthase [Pirellulaceae bacterium]|nr:dihydropteroate synthase [Pirellulaceae bacterium]HMO90882.1 dihydropteroate synthase [Pirellulaceae bacterium]HMP68642.1 dihydropteroate synthase [Pirellulaceae bacterium]